MTMLRPGTLRAMARGNRARRGRSIRMQARILTIIIFGVLIALMLLVAMISQF